MTKRRLEVTVWQIGEIVAVAGEGLDRFQIIEIFDRSVTVRSIDKTGVWMENKEKITRLGFKFPPFERIETIRAVLPPRKA